VVERETRGKPGQGNTSEQNNRTKNLDASEAERDPFYAEFWDRLIEASTILPYEQGGETIRWPLRIINKFEIAIADWRSRHPLDPPELARRKKIGEKLEPYSQSIQRIKVGYQIAAYQYTREQPKGMFDRATPPYLKDTLKSERDTFGAPDKITLTKQEAEIVDRLCKVPSMRIPVKMISHSGRR
jgi:hypothetical protein